MSFSQHPLVNLVLFVRRQVAHFHQRGMWKLACSHPLALNTKMILADVG